MSVVIGVDSGGSKTRALAVTLEGEVVGYAESGGGNPSHDSGYGNNIQTAIRNCLGTGRLDSVTRVVSGIAGLNRPSDQEWAEPATALPGLSAVQVQVNDADIAWFGALEGRPGIISIQGAGSMIYGRTEEDRVVRNFDFRHYASAAGPAIGFRSELLLLARGESIGDADFVAQILDYWGVESVEALREYMSHSRDRDDREFHNRLGSMAPFVTAAAEKGSPLAIGVCEEAARNVVDGIRLLGRMFVLPEVTVAFIGSCVRSPFLRDLVEAGLGAAQEKEYRVVEPKFAPVVGAVLMALQQEDVVLNPERQEQLAQSRFCADIKIVRNEKSLG